MDITKKRCSRCGRLLELKHFHRNKRNPDGFQYWCAFCSTKETKGVEQKKAVVQLSKEYEFIEEFESAWVAEEITGISKKNISSVCNGRRNTAGGFRWIFKEEYDS